jgi:NitT/TauT family transport system substrate-binding protein
MFPAFAIANNLDQASISWLDVSPQLRETMLVQKQADAISAQVTHVPALRRILRPGQSISTMKYSDFGLNLYGHAVITTAEFANKNGDVVRAFVRACVAALKKSITDPSVSIDALYKRDPLVDKSMDSERQQANFENVVLTKHVLANGLSSVVPDRLRANARIVSQAFGFGEIDISKLYRPEFLPAPEELRVPRRM